MTTRTITKIEASNSLADLAARIKAEHEAVIASLKGSVQHAIAAGELFEAKQQLKHGQWLPWLTEHCQVTERTAQRYMRLARNKDKCDSVSDLSLNGALALLTVPRDCSLVEPSLRALDASDAEAAVLSSMAERARRVILDGAAQNVEAIRKFNEKRRPSVAHDRPHPLDDLWSELEHDFEGLSVAYGEAVESDDYEHAFTIAENLHKFTVELRTLAEEWDRNCNCEAAS
jgi:DUF3102 family protein